MRSLSDFIGGLPDVKFWNMPIGTALILSVSMGLTRGIGDIVERIAQLVLPEGYLARIPAAGVQGGIALAVRNVGFLKNLLGDDISNFVSLAALSTGLEDLVNLSNVTRSAVDYIAALIPAPAVTPERVNQIVETPPAGAATSGWSMGQAAVAPGMDDIDLAVMAARGGHPSV